VVVILYLVPLPPYFHAKEGKDESYPNKFLEKFNLKRAEIEDNKKFIHHLPSKTLWVEILSE
jgi:hypothetical protein